MKTEKQLYTIPDFMVVLAMLRLSPGTTMSKIQYRSWIVYSHLHYLKKLFIELKWITTEKEGRTFLITLTPKGEEIADAVLLMFNALEFSIDNIYEMKKKEKKEFRKTLSKNEAVSDKGTSDEDRGTVWDYNTDSE